MIKPYQNISAEKPRGCCLQGVSSDSFVWTLDFGWTIVGIATNLPVEPAQSSAFETAQVLSAVVVTLNGNEILAVCHLNQRYLQLGKMKGWDCHWPNASGNLLTQLPLWSHFPVFETCSKHLCHIRHSWNVLVPEQPPFCVWWSTLGAAHCKTRKCRCPCFSLIHP